MKIYNRTRQTVLADRGRLADTPLSRLKGLLGRDHLDSDEGLVITQCRSIHMLFMRFAIDVVFIDGEGKVIGLVKDIKPYRISGYYWRAWAAVELPAGTIQQTSTQKGDLISWTV
ncbi:MAG: DUF192 domain-containing protein [Candidatus Omnitrophota bacterium]